GLPAGHIWQSGGMTSQQGIFFTANIPTEEVFTLPHKDRIDGQVMSTKPLSIAGQVVEGFTLTLEGGRVVQATAETGERALLDHLETDHGAAAFGEIALVPHSSPISQSGRLFYNILYDENASNHIALGNAYRFSMQGGDTMSEEAWAAAGGNQSMIHTDFMIGSGAMNVDGVLSDGTREALQRGGEWAFEV
ncbi:MAG: aminopeptidase, partial [Anaerolineae bacterium]|nr:aminopeptidase [Anaerolineae bacterium]